MGIMDIVSSYQEVNLGVPETEFPSRYTTLAF